MNNKLVNKDTITQRDSFSELVGQLANNSATVVHDEIELVIQGIREKMTAGRSGVITVLIGAGISFAAFMCLCAEKFDWREYVKDSPYLAIGVAAGLGYIGSRVLITRTTPMERIMDSIAGEVRGSLGGLIAGPGLLKLTLLSIATKAAAGWIKNAASTEVVNGAAGPRPPAGHGSTAGPSAGN